MSDIHLGNLLMKKDGYCGSCRTPIAVNTWAAWHPSIGAKGGTICKQCADKLVQMNAANYYLKNGMLDEKSNTIALNRLPAQPASRPAILPTTFYPPANQPTPMDSAKQLEQQGHIDELRQVIESQGYRIEELFQKCIWFEGLIAELQEKAELRKSKAKLFKEEKKEVYAPAGKLTKAIDIVNVIDPELGVLEP